MPYPYDDQYDSLPSTDLNQERAQQLQDAAGTNDYASYLAQLSAGPQGDFQNQTPAQPGLPAIAPPPMAQVPPPAQNAPISQPSASGDVSNAAPASPADAVKAAMAQKYGYAPGTSQSDLLNAQQLGNSNKLFANLGAATNTIANAISQRQAPADNSAFKGMADDSDQMVKDLLQRRAGQKDEMALARQQELLDPNGVKAAVLRRQLAPLAAKVGMDPKSLDSLSMQDLKDFATGPMEFAAKLRSNEQIHHDNLDMKRLMTQNTLNTKDEKNQTDALKSLKTSKQYQEVDTRVNEADNLLDLIEAAKTNPASKAALATKLSTYISGGGRLHVSTIESMNNVDKSTFGRAMQYLNTAASGTLDESNAAALTKFVQSEAKSAAAARDKMTEKAASDYTAIHHGKAPSWGASAAPSASLPGFDEEMKKRGLN